MVQQYADAEACECRNNQASCDKKKKTKITN